jgi:hypothetical protein
MDPNTLAIPLAFILLAAVLCLLLIGSRWKWWQKLALILIVPAFGLVVWAAIASYKGWPTTEDPPDRSIVCGVLVREPDPGRADPGAIYVWLMPLDEAHQGINPLDYATPGNEPRAFRFPYTRNMHKGMQRAQRMMREGKPVVLDLRGRKRGGGSGEGEPGEGDPDGDGAEGDGGPGGNGHPGYGYDPDRRDFQIYELPPPNPPRKVPE